MTQEKCLFCQIGRIVVTQGVERCDTCGASAPASKATPSHPASPELPESVYAAVSTLKEADEMHLGRCASSEPFTARDYRNHACEARSLVRKAVALLTTTPSIPTPSPAAGLPTPETDAAVSEAHLYSLHGQQIDTLAKCARSLERRLAAARAEVEAKDIVLNAWHNQFGTTQLSHASAEREHLRTQVTDLRAQLATAKEELEDHRAALATIKDRVKADEDFSADEIVDYIEKRVGKYSQGIDWIREGVIKELSDDLAALRSDLAKANAAVEELRACHAGIAQLAKVMGCKTGMTGDEIFAQAAAQLAAQQSVPPAEDEEDVNEDVDTSDFTPKDWERIERYKARFIAATAKAPEARAVEAAEEITLLHLHRRANQTSTDAIAAIIQRVCFPPGEGEGWAKCAEYGWTVIANASGGNWNHQSQDWQDAAAKFREMYHACLKHAPARPTAARETRNLPIDESNLLLLGFIKGQFFNGVQYWEYVVTIEDCSTHEWARIVVCRGSGSDPDCWDIRFHRQDGNTFRPLDRVTLKYGARRMGELIDLINAIDYKRPAIDAARSANNPNSNPPIP